MTALLKEESATRLTRHDLALTCLLLNSADYCIDTISALDDKLIEKASPEFKERIGKLRLNTNIYQFKTCHRRKTFSLMLSRPASAFWYKIQKALADRLSKHCLKQTGLLSIMLRVRHFIKNIK
jgi:hypothetical protein